MIRTKERQNRFFVIILLLVLFLPISGCLENFSLNPLATEKDVQEFVESNIGRIQILKVNSTIMQFLQSNITDSLLTVEKTIHVNSDSVLQVGSDYLGYCKLKFKPGDLPQDVTIKLQWDLNKGNFEVNFQPEGLVFTHPVSLEMFYNVADLTNIDETKLKPFYYNENEKIWQLIGGVADIANKIFKVDIHHFSRYALAHAE